MPPWYFRIQAPNKAKHDRGQRFWRTLCKRATLDEKGLFHRYGFGQIPWLVHIRTLGHGDVIGQKLDGQ